MPRWFTALFWSCITIAAVVVGLSTWDAFSASPPDADPVRVRNVRIERDKWGVPHILGKTDADAAYGLGFAQSEDDFETLRDVTVYLPPDFKPGEETLETRLVSEADVPWDQLAFATVRNTLTHYFADRARKQFGFHMGTIERPPAR